MAERDISGFNGDVTLPSSHGGDPYAWTISVSHRDKETSRYGGDRFVKRRGGLIDPSGTISVFLRMDAASTGPGAMDPVPDGSALTLTAEVGCTYAGTAIIEFNMSHAFADPAVEGTYNWRGNGAWAEVWDETP